MAEEQKWQEATNHVLCANNCGFFGSPTTLNLCSKCYKDHCLKERHLSTAKFAVEKSLLQPESAVPESETAVTESETAVPESSSSSSAAAIFVSAVPDRSVISAPAEAEAADPSSAVGKPSQPQQRNRCGSCRRRVGLTGFTCRCGTTFCGAHRYPEEHDCAFDFKTVGKEAIARENPVVKAAKLERI